LLLSITNTLGCQSKANLADIHRNYKNLSGMQINYKPFHNQLKKAQCSDFFKSCFESVMQQWVLQSLSTGAKFPFSQIKLHDGCSFQRTEPVNHSAGPFCEGWEPLRLSFMSQWIY